MARSFGIACLGTTHPHISARLDVARRIDGIKIIGVADDDPNNAEGLAALAEYLEVPVLSSESLLANAAIDGIIVEPWTHEMVDVAIRCLNAGKHVLVEKPGGSNPKDLDRLVDAARKSGKVVQVGYNFRFSPIVDFARSVIDRDLLGTIVQSQVHAAGPAGDATNPWFNLPDDLGGCFWEDGCHIMDLIVHCFGMPETVSARIPKFASVSGEHSLEDAAVATLEWNSMVMAFDFSSWEANDWLETWQFNLYGTKGTLRFQMLPERYELYLKEGRDEFKKGWNRWNDTSFPTPWAGEPTPWEKWHIVANKSFFFREISAFRAACEESASSPISPAHARDVARVMQACYESSRSDGQGVEIE